MKLLALTGVLASALSLCACGDGGGITIITHGAGIVIGGSDDDFGYSVKQTSDGGFIIAGSTTSFSSGDDDVYLLKIDRNGFLVWEAIYGGDGLDFGNSVIEASDGNYVVAGSTTSFGQGGDDAYLIKTDRDGFLVWYKTFGGGGQDFGYSVKEASDSGFIISGSTSSFGLGRDDIYLIKTDRDGDLIWEEALGGAGFDFGYSVDETFDTGYIVSGTTDFFSAGDNDVYLIKTDRRGFVEF